MKRRLLNLLNLLLKMLKLHLILLSKTLKIQIQKHQNRIVVLNKIIRKKTKTVVIKLPHNIPIKKITGIQTIKNQIISQIGLKVLQARQKKILKNQVKKLSLQK